MTKNIKWAVIFNLLFTLFISLMTATPYAGAFEELGASARALAQGGASVATILDPSTIYYNPSASALVTEQQVMFLHSENFLGGIVKNNFLAFIRPELNQAYGIALLANRIPDIKITKLPNPALPPSDSNQPIIDRIITASDIIAYFNYARLLNNYLSAGGNIKIIYRSLGIGSAFGIGFDIGSMMMITPSFKLGLKVTNFSVSPLFWSNKTREYISPKITLGVAKTFTVQKSNITMSSDLESYFDNFELKNNIGFEYLYNNSLAFRIGLYHYNLTAGVGFSYKKLFIDYAYLSHYNQEDLGASQKFSGGIRF
jgi:hypothetical protein